MKKFSILALAALLVVAFTVPAAALENEFGGYWRTRMYTMGHFNGEEDDATNERLVDTRTRLFYTAKINDNLKLVNAFEMDANWGSAASYGDVGADAVAIEIKHTYADFNTGPVNWTVGAQPYALFRGFAIADDASGIIARWKIMDNFVLAGSWLKNFEGGAGTGNNEDLDQYTMTAAFWFSENLSIKPSISYARSSEATIAPALAAGRNGANGASLLVAPFGEAEIWTYGADFDASFDAFSLWATAFGQTGDIETGIGDVDFSSWLAAIGASANLGPVELHGEFFYTPGDDDAADDEIENIFAPAASYYWSEIMGFGVFDRALPTGSPGDRIFNIMAGNIGVGFAPMDKLKVVADVWYAERDEDDANGENELGTEIDLRVTYELVEGLNLDLVGAYLFAGDAVSADGDNDDDPYEFGARLSLSF